LPAADGKSRAASSVAITTTKELPESHCRLVVSFGFENAWQLQPKREDSL
jgi:hypothetical protein